METEARQHADDSIRGGLGPQQVVQISDSGVKWIVGLMLSFIVIVAVSMLGIGYAIVEANEARDAARIASADARAQWQAVVRLQASLVARGVALPEADPLFNSAPPKPRGQQ